MLFAVILSLTLTLTSACSPGPNFPTSIGMEGTMFLADIVVSGRVTDLNNNSTYAGSKPHVTFAVDCIYKQPTGAGIGGTVIIDGGYKYNSCTTTYLEQDEKYLLALEAKTASDPDEAYRVFEYNVASPAAYKTSEVRLEKLVELCGFKTPVEVSEGACQQPKSTQRCRNVEISAGVVHAATLWATLLSVSLAVLMK
jgi:hypothetical protein